MQIKMLGEASWLFDQRVQENPAVIVWLILTVFKGLILDSAALIQLHAKTSKLSLINMSHNSFLCNTKLLEYPVWVWSFGWGIILIVFAIFCSQVNVGKMDSPIEKWNLIIGNLALKQVIYPIVKSQPQVRYTIRMEQCISDYLNQPKTNSFGSAQKHFYFQTECPSCRRRYGLVSPIWPWKIVQSNCI